MTHEVPDYPEKSLVEKLGIKPGMTVVLLNAPKGYQLLLGKVPGVRLTSRFHQPTSFVQFFSTSRAEFTRILPTLKNQLADHGMLWISWPKKASDVKTDLDENSIRNIGLAHGLVDVKVCAVDDTWSALKFVRRRADQG